MQVTMKHDEIAYGQRHAVDDDNEAGSVWFMRVSAADEPYCFDHDGTVTFIFKS